MSNSTIIVESLPLGLIEVSGPAVEKFLQGQITCDVRDINNQQSRLGAHCDHKGRIQATFRVFIYQNNYYLQLPINLIAHLLNTLKKFAVFSKTNLIDVTHAWQQLSISGISSSTSLAAIFGDKIPVTADEITCHTDIVIICLPGDLPHFCLLGPANSIVPITEHLLLQGATADCSAWQLLDIAAGIPSVYPETIGLFTPQQINYPSINGVSFNKGCYIGQEIIARMHYLGKSKQRMYRIAFNSEAIIVPGTRLFSDDKLMQECGILVQAANKNAKQWLGLATIYNAALEHTIYLGNSNCPILKIESLSYAD